MTTDNNERSERIAYPCHIYYWTGGSACQHCAVTECPKCEGDGEEGDG